MNRGNRKTVIFEDDRDRKRFVGLLVHLSAAFEVTILSGCQMGSHFHLVLSVPQGNLSQFMQQLEGQFARYSNWRHQRIGHLFQGRFKSVLVENDIHLLTAVCYVLMNPVVAGRCQRLEDWRWSTYAATAGLAPVPGFLSIEWLRTLFDDAPIETCQRRFRELMGQARPVNSYLEQFEWRRDCDPAHQVIRSYAGERLHQANVPRQYRPLCRPPLGTLFLPEITREERDQVIHCARVVHGYTSAEIAAAVALSQGTVDNIVRQQSLRRDT